MRNLSGRNIALFVVGVLAAFMLACVSAVAHAQSYGSLVGAVADATGAAVPNATVTITNRATDEKRVERTNAEGTYRIPNLIPGSYREDVESAGFKHFTRDSIKIDVETTARVDVALQIGAASEVVEVNIETPLLQVESATLQQVVGEKTVQEMPLNGKNVLNLIALTPGVVAQGGTAGASGSNQSPGHTNSDAWNNYQIGGGMPGQAAQFLDGAPTTGLGGNQVFLVPNQDSISEFRVASAAVSPEFGRFGGGVVNFTTKSGGNQFHGAAYEYFRNKVLNAATFFGKRNGQPKASYNQNQFGGTFGGPIIRDKLLFFANYEQYKIIAGQTFTALVPTAAERSGDFSADANIYDPYTSVATGSSTNPVTRAQFSCNGKLNVICPARFDSTANVILNMLQYYPLPNTTGAGYNYATNVNPGVQSKQGGIRLDYNVSEKQHFFARYTRWKLSDIPLNQYHNLTGGAGSDQFTHQALLGDTYSFTPKFTGDIRLSYGRGYSSDDNPNYGRDLSVYGPSYASLSSQVTARVNVAATPTGYGNFNGMTNNSSQYRNTYALSPNASYFLGQHQLKFGGDMRFMDFEYVGGGTSGNFTFNNGFTSANGTTSAPTGNAIASELLGAVYTGTTNAVKAVSEYAWYQGYYITDNWQAARKVTVNVGIRYELPGAWSERKDNATVLLPTSTNPLGTVGGYNLQGGLFLVNTQNWASRSTEQKKYDLFSPRIGVSYNPVRDTVVRAGYSLVYIPFDAYEGAAPANSPINAASTTMVTSVNGTGYVPLNTLSDPFPAGGIAGTVQQSILEPVGRNQAYLNNLVGLNISGPVPVIRFPYNQQWTASLQQQFAKDSLLQIAYEGNRGTFLPLGQSYTTGSLFNLNQLPDQYDSIGASLSTNTANPFAGKLNSTGSLNGANVPAGQLLRPFPEYGNVNQSNAKGDNIYHALLVSFQKRFAGGGLINSNYTWAKNMGTASGTPLTQLESGGNQTIGLLQDYTNIRGDRSILNTDVRNRFVTSFVSPLPVGKGHMLLGGASGVAGGFVNGWEVNGIVTLQTGYPLSIATQGNSLSGSFGAGTIRPNYSSGNVSATLGSCNAQRAIIGSAQSRLAKWFNTACFTAPSQYGFGNENRVDGSIRAAGIANYDFSVSKQTGVTERLKLELKAEIFNLFNRVQFNPPATTFGAAAFGTVTTTANQPRQIQLSGRLLF